MGKLNTPLTIFSIYNNFAYVRDTAEEMCGNLKPKCWFYDYYECVNYGNFYFKVNTKYDDIPYKCRVSMNKYEYKYHYELVELLKSHKRWSINISEYNHYLDKFYIYFKRPCVSGAEIHIYSISGEGVKMIEDELGRKIADYVSNDTICTYKTYIDLPAAKQTPTLSKPPIFNPPATICYWTDGTKTVVKCQEGDPYSPEAGLALCYMKKILGNTSKDLNKELHKYISEERRNRVMNCENCKHCEVIEGGKYQLSDGTLILAGGDIRKCKLEKVKSITITDGETVCSDFEEKEEK